MTPLHWFQKFPKGRSGRVALLALALAAALPAGLAMANLYINLRSDLEALLPEESPAVRGVQTLRNRMEGAQHLGIVVRGTKPGPPADFAAELGERLRAYAATRPNLIRSVRTDVAAEREFMRERAFIYLPIERLRDLRYQLSAAIQTATGASFRQLGQRKSPTLDSAGFKAPWPAFDPFADQFPEDRLISNDGLTAVVVVFLATADTGVSIIGPFVDRVRQEVERLAPEARGLQVGYAGDVAIAVEELSALESDIGVAAVLVLFGVACSVMLFFRWWWALPALAVPVAIGTAWGFGISSLFVESLSSSTAFLGSIVVGNGINPGIMLSARYAEERRSGAPPHDAVETAIRGTWQGTLTAAVAASAGYASLITTTFRGFNEFAIIGSVGMLACWWATYLLLPHVLIIIDRRPVVQDQKAKLLSSKGHWLEYLAVRHSRAVLWGSGGLLLTSLLFITQFDDTHIEYDMSKLRNRDSAIHGEAYWSRQMDQVIGRNFTAVALMSSTEADARVIGATLRQQATQEPLSSITSRVVTPDEVLPLDRAERHTEIQAISNLLTPLVRAALPDGVREPLESLVRTAEAPPLTPGEIPELLVLGLREKDGRFGRTVLLLQSLDGSTWNGALTIRAAAALRDIAAQVTPAADVAGGFFVSAHVLEALKSEALPTTLTAFCAIVVIVLVLFRARREAFQVLAALLAGMTLLAGIVMAFDLRINFLNFMAFPVTFGIGVEYAINVLRRHRENPTDMTMVVSKAGGAVALCSFTTILGYGSLLVATNQALFSFGVLAVLGEITCLFAAVVMLPAALAIRQRPEG